MRKSKQKALCVNNRWRQWCENLLHLGLPHRPTSHQVSCRWQLAVAG